jgi:homoserine dehydrogenase
VLRDNDVSMASMIQREREPGEPVAVVLTTHETTEANMMAALATIAAFDKVAEPPRLIRIECA